MTVYCIVCDYSVQLSHAVGNRWIIARNKEESLIPGVCLDCLRRYAMFLEEE